MAREASKNYFEVAPGIFIENIGETKIVYYVIQYPYKPVARVDIDKPIEILDDTLTPKQEHAIREHASEYYK